MKIKELEKEFKLRDSGTGGIEGICAFLFIAAVPLTIFLFDPIWIVIGVIALIVDLVVYSKKRGRRNTFLLDNRDRLDPDEDAKLERYIRFN